MDAVPEHIKALLTQLQAEHGMHFDDISKDASPLANHIDTCYVLLLNQDIPLAAYKQILKSRLENLGWQYSEMDSRPNLIVLAPLLFVSTDVVFHATPVANLGSIFEQGLLPSTPSISGTGRADCQGNIYVCEHLGAAHGHLDQEPDKGSAHWWRWKLSKSSRFGDRNWCILRLQISGFSGRFYRDIWSESGLILYGGSSVPPDLISIEWEQRD